MTQGVVVKQFFGTWEICPLNERLKISPSGGIMSRTNRNAPILTACKNGEEILSINGASYTRKELVYITYIGPIESNHTVALIDETLPIDPSNLELVPWKSRRSGRLRNSVDMVRSKKVVYRDGQWVSPSNRTYERSLTFIANHTRRVYWNVKYLLEKGNADDKPVIIVDKFDPFMGYECQYKN